MSTSLPATRAVLFDLDGTLADTADDLSRALNQVLVEEKRTALPLERIRPTVSLGGLAMLRLAFPGEDFSPSSTRYLRFIEHYARGATERTVMFPGMEQVLAALESANIPWGIVTNKVTRLTEPILEFLRLRQRAACIVCGDTTAFTKPHPAPLLHACTQLGIAPADSVYVGDARRDVEAGNQAGMRTVIAAYGYIEDGEALESWGADTVIEQPNELLPWLGLR